MGIPLGLKIKKEKKYKKVTATRITSNGQHDRDQIHEDRKKYVFKYKWTIDGKTYKKTITTEYYPLEVDTFYYLKPSHAMPSPEELARFRYTK